MLTQEQNDRPTGSRTRCPDGQVDASVVEMMQKIDDLQSAQAD